MLDQMSSYRARQGSSQLLSFMGHVYIEDQPSPPCSQESKFHSNLLLSFLIQILYMHLAESYQLKPQQIAVRDTAQLYLKIEQNTQFLTNVLRHQMGRYRTPFNIQIQQIQIKSFFNAIVQVSYLLYFCTIKKVSLYLSRDIYINNNRENPQIVFEFILEKEMINLDEEKQRHLHKLFFYINPFKHENSYTFCLVQFIKNTLEVLRAYLQKHKDKKVLGDKVLMKQLESFGFAMALLEPQIKNGLKPKTLISCLQQTDLFRINSGLLKTLNCSIYQNIRKTNNIQQIIFSIRKQELKLIEMIQQIKNNSTSELEFLQRQEKTLEKQTQAFFEGLLQLKIIHASDSRKFCETVDNLKGQKMIRFAFMVETKGFRKFSQELIAEIDTGKTTSEADRMNKGYNSFEVDFYLKRRVVCIKCFLEISIGAENYDMVMYHCNNMMNRWENASMQIQEPKKSEGSRKKQKMLCFKVISHFYAKDSPFTKILLGIDMAMIYAKMSEPAILQENIRFDDHQKFILTGKKIEHLSSLFIKKIKRFYDNIISKMPM